MAEKLRRGFLRTSILSLAGLLASGGNIWGRGHSEKPGTTTRKGAGWHPVLELNNRRERVAGSEKELLRAIKNGADLRIYTEFKHNEHIDTSSDNPELIQEVADFRVTYVLDGRWVAGIINLRQPIALPDGFGPRPSMSFFLYNQDASQAIARPYLDGAAADGKKGAGILDDHSDMPKYHQFDAWDSGTNAPSSNFVYDFEKYKFCVCDNWEEVYAHNAEGKKTSGSVDALADAFSNGREVKVAISGLCNDMGEASMDHEVFMHCGSCYYYTKRKLFIAASHPVVRVEPAIPMKYKSEGWDFGWLMPRSDGHVARWIVDPYTLKFKKDSGRYSMRWFVR